MWEITAEKSSRMEGRQGPHTEELQWVQSRINRKKSTLRFMRVKLYNAKVTEKIQNCQRKKDSPTKKWQLDQQEASQQLWRPEDKKEYLQSIRKTTVSQDFSSWTIISRRGQIRPPPPRTTSFPLSDSAAWAGITTPGWVCSNRLCCPPPNRLCCPLLIFSRPGLGPPNLHF